MTSRPHWPFGLSRPLGNGEAPRRPGPRDPAAGGVFRADRLIHRTGHPSFTDAVARSLVSGLTVSQLHDVWSLSGVALLHPLHPRTTTNLVVLRGAVLDALALADPAFLVWLGDQPLPPGPPVHS